MQIVVVVTRSSVSSWTARRHLSLFFDKPPALLNLFNIATQVKCQCSFRQLCAVGPTETIAYQACDVYVVLSPWPPDHDPRLTTHIIKHPGRATSTRSSASIDHYGWWTRTWSRPCVYPWRLARCRWPRQIHDFLHAICMEVLEQRRRWGRATWQQRSIMLCQASCHIWLFISTADCLSTSVVECTWWMLSFSKQPTNNTTYVK